MGVAIFCPSFCFFCYIGENVATNSSNIHEILYAIPWHLCSTTFQKDVMQMLSITQYSIYFDGLFAMDCSQNTFKTVRVLLLFWMIQKKEEFENIYSLFRLWRLAIHILWCYVVWISSKNQRRKAEMSKLEEIVAFQFHCQLKGSLVQKHFFLYCQCEPVYGLNRKI